MSAWLRGIADAAAMSMNMTTAEALEAVQTALTTPPPPPPAATAAAATPEGAAKGAGARGAAGAAPSGPAESNSGPSVALADVFNRLLG